MGTRWCTLDRWAMRTTVSTVTKPGVRDAGRETIGGLRRHDIAHLGCRGTYCGKSAPTFVADKVYRNSVGFAKVLSQTKELFHLGKNFCERTFAKELLQNQRD